MPLGASAGPSESPGRAPAEVRDAVTQGRDRLGLQVQPLDSQTVGQTGVLSSQGVLVTVVELGGAAGLAGIRPGDVIRRVNRQTVGSVGDFERAMGAITGGELVRLWIQRGHTSLLVVLEP